MSKSNIPNDKEPPGKLVSDIKHDLQKRQEDLNVASKDAGRALEIVSSGEPYWQGLDSAFRSGELQNDPVASSGYEFLERFHGQVSSIGPISREVRTSLQNAAGTASVFGTLTTDSAAYSHIPTTFNPEPLRRYRDTFERHEDYVCRLKTVDPSLAETFKGMIDAYFTGSSDSIRHALFGARQTFDHFFELLTPDDEEVRKQDWWSPSPNANDPEGVTRAQRIRYSAEKHVDDLDEQLVLTSAADHMTQIYNRSQALHKRGALDEEKAKDTLFDMITLLRKWIDTVFPE